MTRAEKDRIFMKHYGLVSKVLKDCNEFVGNAGIFTKDDLMQIGSVGLLKAIDSFKADRNCRFSTYAYILIRNELVNEVMKEARRHGKETKDTEDEFLLSSYAVANSGPDSETLDELLHILSRAKEKASGSIRLGIDAIILISQDYTGSEIAKLLGITPGNARVCVSRARKYLQERKFFSAYRN